MHVGKHRHPANRAKFIISPTKTEIHEGRKGNENSKPKSKNSQSVLSVSDGSEDEDPEKNNSPGKERSPRFRPNSLLVIYDQLRRVCEHITLCICTPTCCLSPRCARLHHPRPHFCAFPVWITRTQRKVYACITASQ